MLGHLALAALETLDLLKDASSQHILTLHERLVARYTPLPLLLELAVLLLELFIVLRLNLFQFFHKFLAHAFVALLYDLCLALQIKHLLLQADVVLLELGRCLQPRLHLFKAVLVASRGHLGLLSEATHLIF